MTTITALHDWEASAVKEKELGFGYSSGRCSRRS